MSFYLSSGRLHKSFLTEPRVHLARGFTLIEILVVMVIIALMLSMAVISVGDNFQRKMQTEAERLQTLLIAAADEAIYNGNELGIYFSEQGYVPLRFDQVARGWVIINRRPFMHHRLPANMLIDWEIEGFAKPTDSDEPEYVDSEFLEDVDASTDDLSRFDDISESADSFAQLAEGSLAEALRQETVDLVPHIYFLSSGEQTAFKASFKRGFENNVDSIVTLVSDGFSMPYIKTEQGQGGSEGE